jgi:tocopherol cyclase
MALLSALARTWRRTGADVPFGDPRPTHGAEMEGYFWRFTDAAAGRVVVALCGVNRHSGGDWATVAVAAHPGGVLRHAAVDDAWASPDRLEVRAGDVLEADAGHLRVTLDGVRVEARLHDVVGWPRRPLHGSGLVSVLPFLGQYWHPHVLDGRVRGSADLGEGDRWSLDESAVYAEKNWGSGFPERWWWGQAHGFDRPDVCVAFAGGHLTSPVRRFGVDIGGAMIRLGGQVVRIAPPLGVVRTTVDGGRWTVDARGARWRLRMEGDGNGRVPHRLPVPVPAERRNILADFEHQGGHLRVRAERAGRLVYEGESNLAALEVGSLDPQASYESLVRAPA